MSQVESRIQAAASRNSELLGILGETDYAPPALEQQRRYIADLEHETQRLNRNIKDLATRREKELKDHEKYRDSVMKRFAYKATGKKEKFDAKAGKEEREYFDVLQEEHREKEVRKTLEPQLKEAIQARQHLEGVVARHGKAQKDLDDLYDSIFQGPTPGFPEEDDKERAAQTALQRYHDQRVRTESEDQAIKILRQARNRMARALGAMQSALGHSRMDMFGGGVMSDMMERNAINAAEVATMECNMLVMQAQRISPAVSALPPVNIAKGNLMSDVLFDNVFTDMAFHEKIKQSMAELQTAAIALEQQIRMATERFQSNQRRVAQEAKALSDARLTLQKTREAVFEAAAGGAPPQYT